MTANDERALFEAREPYNEWRDAARKLHEHNNTYSAFKAGAEWQAARKPASAEPVGEPDYWMAPNGIAWTPSETKKHGFLKERENWAPLYLRPASQPGPVAPSSAEIGSASWSSIPET